ncbi:ABC transporter ATP-binding protein [Brevibacillus sp. B_LB10_24]|uniref:ABC transporter ATP-binding protein n=1 Tax=Brevibacillus sp. B_LB10_24 TaxID=3380645 RepID=UPI0038BB75FC
MRGTENEKYLLELRALKKHFNLSGGWLSKKKEVLRAVDGIDLQIKKGETVGIVGESGCGKSTTGNMVVQLLEPTEGQILFEGRDLFSMTKEELASRRPDIQMIFQDPFSSLNPRMRVFDIIAEPLRTHKKAGGAELGKRVADLMDTVGLSKTYAHRFPHEFSGGQRQRVGIARALALNPKLIVCDEPVSALDVSIQAQILNLLQSLQKEFQLTYMFIAHGIPAIKYISDRIAVMYLGKIVEVGEKEQIFQQPLHPYTKGLLSAVPVPDPFRRNERGRIFLSGEIPNAINPPSGCRFHTRCPYADKKCKEEVPSLREIGPGQQVACHYSVV